MPGDDSHWRLFGDLIAQVKPTSWLSLGATADVGRQDRAGGAALWHGAALFARIAVAPRAALALRAEYYDDRDGFFSGTAQVLREGTATLELRPADHLIVKLEGLIGRKKGMTQVFGEDGAGNPIFSKTQTLAIASAVAEF